ncbi:hypothetical protein V6N13_149569 [Hibiscus sabdariffa]|uniref:Uncharacterized protein n=1 Tax=Hibiscus sabdariffa TaxID=183260 RepID=A0ABR2EHF1_9ROSI
MQFAGTLSAARKYVGEYQRAVIKDQTIPEALMELVRVEAASAGSEEKPTFSDDFKPEPNLSAYGDDVKLKGKKKSFTSDFEAEPNLSVYQD